jgi:Dullard-like phosphatase family protein
MKVDVPRPPDQAGEAPSVESCPRSSSLPALVFDLDETLIFSSAISPNCASIPIRVGRRRMYVRQRPGLADFLDAVSRRFDLFFFTASERDYANQIIDAIAPKTPHDHRFFRDSCATRSGYSVKDLRLIKRPLTHVLIIDDIEGSALLQPQNLVRIAPWYGKEDDDVLSAQLLPILIECAGEGDLPRAFRNYVAQKQLDSIHPSRSIRSCIA